MDISEVTNGEWLIIGCLLFILGDVAIMMPTELNAQVHFSSAKFNHHG